MQLLGMTALTLWQMQSSRGGVGSNGIRDALYATKGISGLTGPTTFDEHGDVLKSYDLFKITNGGFVKQQ